MWEPRLAEMYACTLISVASIQPYHETASTSTADEASSYGGLLSFRIRPRSQFDLELKLNLREELRHLPDPQMGPVLGLNRMAPL